MRQIDKADLFFQKRNQNHLRYAINLTGWIGFQNWGDDYPVSISFGCLAENKDERTRIVKALTESGVESRLFSAGDLSQHPAFKNKFEVHTNETAKRVHNTRFLFAESDTT